MQRIKNTKIDVQALTPQVELNESFPVEGENPQMMFASLQEKLAAYLAAEQLALVERAYHIADKAHEGQFRRSGDPYITHPIAVASILADLRMDHQTIMAALIHDVLEDSEISKQDLAHEFGESVAELVDGVSKLTQIHVETRAQQQAENFRKMLLAMVRDIRVILIKLADRLHNMRTLQNMPPKKRQRIARETLEIYAPIASRLGMHAFRVEFEDLGFAALYPMRYRILHFAVKRARGNRKEIVKNIKKCLRETLDARGISLASVLGRKKHLYAIYKKMANKHLSFAEIMDVYGFRIIVDDIDNCYRVLGIVHSLYKPLSNRFKDYIAIPKANGYQSLHTTLFGPYGVPIEIQIRTQAMNQVAENGIAAHWLYKNSEDALDETQIKAQQWLNNLLEIQKNTGNSMEFIENIKVDLFPDEVYVFTPKGDIMELPRGATPVDFAYSIHSDIGNTCIAAKVERRLAPLSQPLMNGQTVEIITANDARPNPAWLNFVVTSKARIGIRHFLRDQKHAQSAALGKELLNKALHHFQKSLTDINENQLHQLSEQLHYSSVEQLYEAIGLGNQVSALIAKRLLEENEEISHHDCLIHEENPVVILGTEGMVVTYPQCCRPVPGDTIVGCLAPGKGVVVHRDDCNEINNLRCQPDKLISLRFDERISGQFKAEIKIDVMNQRWVLAQLAGVIAECEANIDDISVDQGDGNYSSVYFLLTVKSLTHLDQIIRRLKAMKVVMAVTRGGNKNYGQNDYPDQ